MLYETTNKAFRVGDLVLIKATGQVGKITAYEHGQWRVELQGATVLKESTEIERRQALFG